MERRRGEVAKSNAWLRPDKRRTIRKCLNRRPVNLCLLARPALAEHEACSFSFVSLGPVPRGLAKVCGGWKLAQQSSITLLAPGRFPHSLKVGMAKAAREQTPATAAEATHTQKPSTAGQEHASTPATPGTQSAADEQHPGIPVSDRLQKPKKKSHARQLQGKALRAPHLQERRGTRNQPWEREGKGREAPGGPNRTKDNDGQAMRVARGEGSSHPSMGNQLRQQKHKHFPPAPLLVLLLPIFSLLLHEREGAWPCFLFTLFFVPSLLPSAHLCRLPPLFPFPRLQSALACSLPIFVPFSSLNVFLYWIPPLDAHRITTSRTHLFRFFIPIL